METDLVDCELSGTTLRASDVAGNTVRFDLTGWDRLSTPRQFDEPIDTTVVGRVSKIRYDLENYVDVRRLDGSIPTSDANSTRTSYEITGEDDVSLALPAGSYFLRIESDVLVRLRFEGRATISNHPSGSLSVSFPHPTPVTFGFTTTIDYPRHELTIEPTTDAFATALSHLSATVQTTGPNRVHRPYRGYPPLLAVGSETAIPDAIRDRTPETGIELLVPDRWGPLFVAAPLAYYLGATVRTDDRADRNPVLRAPAVDLIHEFSSQPAFQAEAATLLARTFFFDLLTCWLDADDPTLLEHELVDAAGVDLAAYVDAPMAERVAAYCDVPAPLVDEVVPVWPYRMRVEPSPAHAPTVPHLLHDLAVIDTAGACVETAADDATPVELLERAKPICGRVGRTGTDAQFTAPPIAYENRLSALEDERDEVSVAVVFADERRTTVDDRARIVDGYRRRGDRLAVALERYEEPTRGELLTLFETGVDFLHYVGDDEGGGIACADDFLEADSLETNRAKLVYLDAPNSHDAGTELVETGSVACLTRETCAPGAKRPVETTVGEFVLYGQSLATATVLADNCNAAASRPRPERRVVGDGTHRFLPKWKPNHVCVLTPEGTGVRGTILPFPVDPVGAHWVANWHAGKRLMPTTISFALEPEELADYVSSCVAPIYYDGTLYWKEEHGQLLYPIS